MQLKRKQISGMIENTPNNSFHILLTIIPVRVIKHWLSPMVTRKVNIDVKFLNKKINLLRIKFK